MCECMVVASGECCIPGELPARICNSKDIIITHQRNITSNLSSACPSFPLYRSARASQRAENSDPAVAKVFLAEFGKQQRRLARIITRREDEKVLSGRYEIAFALKPNKNSFEQCLAGKGHGARAVRVTRVPHCLYSFRDHPIM